jgi:ATP-dependent helicase/nuclease subunit A
MHAVLRDVSFESSRDTIAKLVDLNARSIGAPIEEVVAARFAIEATLAHPLMTRARAAGRIHREYPVTLPLDDGTLPEEGAMLEGVIDLAFIENGAWVIVDFKTDTDSSSDSGARRAQYLRQLQWYGYALERLTGIPAKAYLLEV